MTRHASRIAPTLAPRIKPMTKAVVMPRPRWLKERNRGGANQSSRKGHSLRSGRELLIRCPEAENLS